MPLAVLSNPPKVPRSDDDAAGIEKRVRCRAVWGANESADDLSGVVDAVCGTEGTARSGAQIRYAPGRSVGESVRSNYAAAAGHRN